MGYRVPCMPEHVFCFGHHLRHWHYAGHTGSGLCVQYVCTWTNFTFKPSLIILQSFDTTYTMMGLAFSLQIFSLHSFSPLTSAMIKWLGIRVVSFLSGTAMALGLFCCTFATCAPCFCIPFGIVFGIGGSFGFMVNSVIVSQYFEKVSTEHNYAAARAGLNDM